MGFDVFVAAGLAKHLNEPHDVLAAALVDFCDRLSVKEGLMYRLPTEEEWERAVRGTERRSSSSALCRSVLHVAARHRPVDPDLRRTGQADSTSMTEAVSLAAQLAVGKTHSAAQPQ